GGYFSGVTLRPEVTVTAESDAAKAAALHHDAHEKCFIANSVNFRSPVNRRSSGRRRPRFHEKPSTRAFGAPEHLDQRDRKPDDRPQRGCDEPDSQTGSRQHAHDGAGTQRGGGNRPDGLVRDMTAEDRERRFVEAHGTGSGLSSG